jgi:hypothetical protein
MNKYLPGIYFKDTKKSRTWWCFIAPIRPRMEIKIRNTPHARIPPMIGRFVTTAEALPYTATPIRMNATSCNTNNEPIH